MRSHKVWDCMVMVGFGEKSHRPPLSIVDPKLLKAHLLQFYETFPSATLRENAAYVRERFSKDFPKMLRSLLSGPIRV